MPMLLFLVAEIIAIVLLFQMGTVLATTVALFLSLVIGVYLIDVIVKVLVNERMKER